MAGDLPLFYETVVPLNRESHRDLLLREDGLQYGFARSTNVIPCVVDEFAAACRHLPIVFMPGVTQPTAVFLVGVRSGTNALVDADGRWTGSYAPAFARRYPFMMGEVPDRDPLVCIDERCAHLGSEGGERLFELDGSETQLLRDRVRFVTDFYAAAKRTDAFSALMTELRLFRGITVEAKGPDGGTSTLSGFLSIDEAKLAALPDEEHLRLKREGLLGPIYAHLISLASVDRLQPAETTA
jgi:hypothetical protein